MIKRCLLLVLLPGVLAMSFFMLSPGSRPNVVGATSGCPRGSGEIWNGPVEIDAVCQVWGVTIKGDVTIRGGGRLILQDSTVIGNVTVVNGGQMDTATTNKPIRVTDVISANVACPSGAPFTAATTICK